MKTRPPQKKLILIFQSGLCYGNFKPQIN